MIAEKTLITMKKRYDFTLFFRKDDTVGSLTAIAPKGYPESDKLFTWKEIEVMRDLYDSLPQPQWSNDLVKRQSQLYDFQEKIKGIVRSRRS